MVIQESRYTHIITILQQQKRPKITQKTNIFKCCNFCTITALDYINSNVHVYFQQKYDLRVENQMGDFYQFENANKPPLIWLVVMI